MAAVEIQTELLEQLEKGNVVLFVGAGLSRAAGLPSGNELKCQLAERAGLGDVSSKTFPQVAEAYERKRGAWSLTNYIADCIECAAAKPARAHHLIAALPFAKIISTNWDNLLKEAMRMAGKLCVEVVRDREISYADETKVLLVKSHGSVGQRDSIVATEEQYYDVFARLPEVSKVISSFLATKTILFLGFGLADEDFKWLYREVVRNLAPHQRRHYAVQLHPKEDDIELWRQKSVTIIDADVTEFLESFLIRTGRQIEDTRLMSPRARRYFEEVFSPRYEMLLAKVGQIALKILIWEPPPSMKKLYHKCLRIRGELHKKGHIACFPEEGQLDHTKVVVCSQEGIKILDATAADLVVVIQPSYAVIGEIQDFEFSVIPYSMLIFVDEKAADSYKYQLTHSEMQALYDNVQRYKYPKDVDECHLLSMVLDKVDKMQMTRYREITSTESWRLATG